MRCSDAPLDFVACNDAKQLQSSPTIMKRCGSFNSCVYWTLSLAILLVPSALQAVIQGVLEPSGRERAYTIPQSAPLVTWLGPAARTCMDAGNREGCNTVANLCALQMYST